MNDLLFWLALTCIFTGALWIPYILNAFFLNGILTTMEYPAVLNLSTWALRAKKAHTNAIENLMVFAPLVLIFTFLAKENSSLAGENINGLVLASKIYFSARLSHFICYTFKISYLRTLSFLIGFGVQVYFIFVIFSMLSK